MIRTKYIIIFFISFFCGGIFGILLFGNKNIQTKLVIDEIIICERLGGQYSIYKSLYNDKYIEYCNIKSKELYNNKLNYEKH